MKKLAKMTSFWKIGFVNLVSFKASFFMTLFHGYFIWQVFSKSLKPKFPKLSNLASFHGSVVKSSPSIPGMRKQEGRRKRRRDRPSQRPFFYLTRSSTPELLEA